MFFTLPTLLTWTRIVAIPLIVGVFYLPIEQQTANMAATVMFIVFAWTDWLDGFLARRLNQTSSFGAFLDPVADKLLVASAILMLVGYDRAPLLPSLIILLREIMVSGSIGIPERPGMSYTMTGVSTESASERKCASTPAWLGLL